MHAAQDARTQTGVSILWLRLVGLCARASAKVGAESQTLGLDGVVDYGLAVVERFAQLESLYGYLLEEADMGAEAGGKLRKAILTGFESVYCMAAVRSMAR